MLEQNLSLSGQGLRQAGQGIQQIDQMFLQNKQQQKPAFIPFMTGGYPTYEASIDIALALQEAGASILEVGFPYSDPLADGPVIQATSEKALEGGMTFAKGLQLITDMRQAGVTIPLVIFCYFNPILQYGIETFAMEAKEKGANGVLVPDLPHEEAQDLEAACRSHGLAYISLVAPTSQARIKMIVERAQGFVYCISSLGVTGVREELSEQIGSFLDDIRPHTQTPLAVGFGVSKREHVQQLAPKAEGIIIGSAIMKLIQEHETLFKHRETKHEGLAHIKHFVKELFSSGDS